MEIPEDVLRRSIANLSDADLRKRWAAKEFTDEALTIAAEELAKRSIETEPEALRRAISEDAANAVAFDRGGAASSARHIIRAASTAGGLVGLGFVGAIAGLALGYAISAPAAKWLERATKTRGALLGAATALGIAVFAVVSVASTVIRLSLRAAT